MPCISSFLLFSFSGSISKLALNPDVEVRAGFASVLLQFGIAIPKSGHSKFYDIEVSMQIHFVRAN